MDESNKLIIRLRELETEIQRLQYSMQDILDDNSLLESDRHALEGQFKDYQNILYNFMYGIDSFLVARDQPVIYGPNPSARRKEDIELPY